MALKYLLAGGNICVVAVVFFLFLIAQALASLVDYFVSFWTNIEEFRNSTLTSNNDTTVATNNNFPQLPMDTCINIYTGLIVGLFVIAFVRSMMFYKLAMCSSKSLHNSMFENVIKAPMRFFDTNPSGRILNRFSKDIGNIDEWLPKVVLDAAQVSYQYSSIKYYVHIFIQYALLLEGIITTETKIFFQTGDA